MYRYRTVVFWCTLLLSLASLSAFAGNQPGRGRSTASAQPAYDYIPGEVVVKFKKAVGQVETNPKARRLMTQMGAMSMEKVFPWKPFDPTFTIDKTGLSQMYVVKVAGTTDIPQLAAQIARDANVEFAEPNYLIPFDAAPAPGAYTSPPDSLIPNDPLYSSEQHLWQVQAAQAWDINTGDSTVIIGIIDTGVDYDHPDLAAHVWNNADEIPDNDIDDDGNGFIDDTRGWDFVDGIVGGSGTGDPDANDDLTTPDNNPMDYQGHGTHVAGIASAVGNNGVGVASLTWNSKVMPLRIGYRTNDNRGLGSSVWMSQAQVYAADNGAHVTNLSFGTSQASLEGARYAFLHGVVVCNSAGNSDDGIGGGEFVSLLGQQPYALAVSAVAANDRKASYSSYHADVDISAPGGDFAADPGFLSTLVNPSPFYGGQLYGYFQGTSMASPYVASLAALIKSANPSWSPADIMFQITGTADDIDALNPDYAGKLGAGRINAYRALTETPPAPLPRVAFVTVTTTDSISGNNDGLLTAGEDGEVIVTIENTWGDAQNVAITFTTDSPDLAITNATSVFATLKGISDLENSRLSNMAAPITFSVNANVNLPTIIRGKVTLTADGGIMLEQEFDIGINPAILFVDDDDGTANVEDYFTDEMKAMNLPYLHWDHTIRGTPSAAQMSKFAAVVWACEWAFPSLDSADRAELGTYLDGGGRLFLSGQDIGWDLADTTNNLNQWYASGGVTKAWYETYLHTQYMRDDKTGEVASTPMQGVDGDPIGDGISFSAAEPLRAAANQYPDLLVPLSGASSVFTYSDDSSGATRYDGTSRVVYFGFGGFESIVENEARSLVFQRVISWLTGKSLEFTTFEDTEDSTSVFNVEATVVSTIDPVTSVTLYWDTDGSFPYNEVAMTPAGGNLYTGTIPAPNATTVMNYVVLAQTGTSYVSAGIKSFNVGIDQIAPAITLLDSLKNTIKAMGPFSVTFHASDNINLDLSSAFIHYNVNGGPDSAVPLSIAIAKAGNAAAQSTPVVKEETFAGEFTLPTPASGGSAVNYYVTVNDLTSQHNAGRYPAAGYKSAYVGTEVLDDFETATAQWDFGTSWGRTTQYKYNGTHSMTDSPSGNYAPNADNTLTLTAPFDLRQFNRGRLYFHRRFIMVAGDTCHVERSQDGVNWTSMKKLNGNDFFSFKQDSIGLPTGAGAENIQFRFRFTSNAAGQFDGIYIDNIEVKTDDFLGGAASLDFSSWPLSFDSTDVDSADERTDSVFVRNVGSLPLTITSVTSSNSAEFTVSPPSATIAPGDSQKFSVTFAPAAFGERTTLITFVHDGTSEKEDLPVTGVGSSRNIDVHVTYGSSWQMVSVPITSLDSAYVLPALFSYEGRYEQASSMTYGRGYWAKPGTSVAYRGLPVNAGEMPVEPMWNMVGSTTAPYPTTAIVSAPPENVVSNYIGYSAEGGYTVADTIEPGRAYWVKATTGGTLTFPGALNTPKNQPGTAFADVLGKFNTLRFADARGQARTLYFGAATENGTDLTPFILPPPPPSGAFDARFGEDRMIASYDGTPGQPANHQIALQSATYPVAVSWTATGDKSYRYTLYVTDARTGKVAAKRLNESGSIALAGPEQLRLEIQTNVLPAEFALRQNYPNPFNPATTIRYELPADASVKLVIFDVLGKEVAQLVNEEQAAGFYDLEFAATHLASGVYFYRLTAEYGNAGGERQTYSSIAKMLLMK